MAENEYLTNLEKPDPVVEMKKRYVQSLHQLNRCQYVLHIGLCHCN